ncbi:TonB-dependent receptor [Litorimonas sp. RW-G-Af-16]|uniref:TonB-dependent receptor n=1 Tax=Litorimonas sp. RW-G-Af-16 TaxID=3241168 RepID=UPI003AAC030D
MTSANNFKRAYMASAAATALTLALSFSATAQDAPIVEDEVVATGIRQSIADSLKLKRESSSIVEAITAEDIGKLPDVSIADSLARLPGVTAQRVRGRAQQISIRGLGPDFSVALLNGREMVSAGNNRGIEFDVFPSELIAQGVVYKTPDARLAATGIAGAVDLRTVRPLDRTEQSINLSAKYIFNDNGNLNPDFSDQGYRLFGSYIDQNEDGTIGWSLGVTHQSNPTQYFSRELKPQNPGSLNGISYPQDNPRSGVVSRDFKRTSMAGTLQFEPTDAFQATFDVAYSDFDDEGIFRGVETPLATWAGVSGPSAVTGQSGSYADSATYENVGPIVHTDTEGNTAEIFAIGANFSNQFSDRVKGTIDISMSTLDKSDIDYESYAGRGGQILQTNVNPDPGGDFIPGFRDTSLLNTLTYDLPEDGEYSINAGSDFADPSQIFLTDPGGWGQVGFVKEPSIEDDLIQLRGEVEYGVDKGFIEGIVVGALVTDREKSFNSNESFLREGAGFVRTDDDPRFPRSIQAPIPGAGSAGSTNSGNLGLDVVVYDPATLRDDGTYRVEAANSVAWTVEEDIITGYAMANISHDGAVPIRGNIGVQYVDTRQSSTGTLAGAGEQTITDSYSDWLPSANLSFEVSEDTFIRAAAARTLTRPRLDQMAANQSVNVNSQVCRDTNADGVPDVVTGFNPAMNDFCFNLSGGNPLLRPYSSTQFDLAFEKYFAEDSAIAIAVFHKDISDYVVNRNIQVDISQQIRQAGFGSILNGSPEIAIAGQSTDENFETAKITGIEATVRQSFDRFLPENLAGFGIDASITYADSSLTLEDGSDRNIPGYSKTTWSASGYYENHGFQARLNSRYRSKFLSEIQQFDGALIGQDATSELIFDAQIGYAWDDGPLEGFGVNLEAYNLTDEPFRTSFDIDGERVISRHELYGRTFNVTVSKKF